MQYKLCRHDALCKGADISDHKHMFLLFLTAGKIGFVVCSCLKPEYSKVFLLRCIFLKRCSSFFTCHEHAIARTLLYRLRVFAKCWQELGVGVPPEPEWMSEARLQPVNC